MALGDITNVKNAGQYEVRVCLDAKYAPIIKKGVRHDMQIDKKWQFPHLRELGALNIDAWLCEEIYPVDPRTNKPPPISTLKQFLTYLAEGQKGLWGYTHELAKNANVDMVQRLEMLKTDNSRLQLALQSATAEVVFLKGKLHDQEVDNKSVLKTKEKEITQLKAKFDKLKTDGYIRQRKDLAQLSQTSGNAKRRRAQVRGGLQPATAKKARLENENGSCKKRLCGDSTAQKKNATVIATLLTSTEKQELLKQPRMKKAVVQSTNEILHEVGEKIGPAGVLSVCDHNGVSQKGYGAIFKTMSNRVKLVHKDLRVGALPKPKHVATFRQQLNANLTTFVGTYYSLNTVLPNSKLKKKSSSNGEKPRIINLSNQNSIFADLEVVQRSMVQFYDLFLEELEGRPLVFVLKMDEAEIVKSQKMERVSITLMNRALDGRISTDDDKYFSVQSDQELWPIAAFQVSKESHEQLKFIFSRTMFPEIISRQEAGEELHVPGMGSYKVQWHLAADMKTIKCLFGFKHGATATHSCIYCLQGRAKKELLQNQGEDVRARKQRAAPSWSGGLFSKSVKALPNRGCSADPDFDPILPIKLARVHICTLHAVNRITEKMLNMHFMWIWNMQDSQVREKAIKDMETSLSMAGIHGGHVQIFKDAKLSGNTGSTPARLSMNGSHVKRMFKPSPYSQRDKLWKDVVEADNCSNPTTKIRRMQLWEAYEQLQPYLRGLTITDEQQQGFKHTVDKWAKLFIDAWGEQHITHYMHVLVRHAPWFIEEYGSLSLWSCQGLERSHAAAKAAYHRHTQHSGGRRLISPLVQVWQHWFRNIQHRKPLTE